MNRTSSNERPDMMPAAPLPVSFISFDVEALPGRASQDHVDRLIWGKFGTGEFGLRRISNILCQHRIKGNFLIDFAMCALYGDKAVQQIAAYLLEQGHEVHSHLHSEWLVRKWGITGDWSGPIGMDRLDARLNESFLQFLAFKYRQIVGHSPELFRAGSYLFSRHTLEAARQAGFTALSNFNSERHADSWLVSAEAAHNAPFIWEQGLIELPVDISPEPLTSCWENYIGTFDRVNTRKTIMTFNVVLHSTSLLQRSDAGQFERFNPSHEDRFHQICEHLTAHTSVQGYSQYLASQPKLPVLRQASCRAIPVRIKSPLHGCAICGCAFGSDLKTDGCPSCGDPVNPPAPAQFAHAVTDIAT